MKLDSVISEMIHDRNGIYDHLTTQILDRIPEVLAGINKFFADTNRNITYGDIFLDHDNTSIFITSKPTINTDTKQQQQLTIGIPLNLVSEGNADVIYHFLLKADLAKKQHAQLNAASIVKPKKYTLH